MTELTFTTVSYESHEQQVTWRGVSMDESSWQQALGQREGDVYRKVWRVLEGLD